MIVALDLYMDAPDMSVPLVESRSAQQAADRRAAGSGDVPPRRADRDRGREPRRRRRSRSTIDAPLGLGGSVNMIVPAGEMKLQLVSPSARGVIE